MYVGTGLGRIGKGGYVFFVEIEGKE